MYSFTDLQRVLDDHNVEEHLFVIFLQFILTQFFILSNGLIKILVFTSTTLSSSAPEFSELFLMIYVPSVSNSSPSYSESWKISRLNRM